MEELVLGLRKINTNHVEEVRKTLDKLFENVKSMGQMNELRFTIDDYLDEGYMVRSYIFKYNSLMKRLRNGN